MGVTDEHWVLAEGYSDADHPGTAHAMGAEWLLCGHNVFGRAWYDGELDGIFGPQAARASRQAKWDIGYSESYVDPSFGTMLRDLLTGTRAQTDEMKGRAALRIAKYVWPTKPHGTVIGWPGQGTHSFKSPPNNWESDNAWDIAVPAGSTVVAIADGEIGPQFGPLGDRDPRFAGIRLHLVVEGNEFYYAHLSSTARGIRPTVFVKQGQTLGESGMANGVAHLHIATKRLFPFVSQAA